MARLTSPSGAVVEVRDDKVADMVRRGYEAEKSTSTRTAKKATAKKS